MRQENKNLWKMHQENFAVYAIKHKTEPTTANF